MNIIKWPLQNNEQGSDICTNNANMMYSWHGGDMDARNSYDTKEQGLSSEDVRTFCFLHVKRGLCCVLFPVACLFD
jgi:hypothetical protein